MADANPKPYTFTCSICEQEILRSELHHHFILNGYLGCENKPRDLKEWLNSDEAKAISRRIQFPNK